MFHITVFNKPRAVDLLIC